MLPHRKERNEMDDATPMLQELHGLVVKRLDPRNPGMEGAGEERLRTEAIRIVREEAGRYGWPEDRTEEAVRRLLDDLFGYGPISPLLADPEVTEIMVNGSRSVYVERHGLLLPAEVEFPNDFALRAVIDRMASRVNRRIDESCPFVDARLPDGSRVHAAIPPVTLDGPCLTVRKFRPAPFTTAELVSCGALTAEAEAYLVEAVTGRRNVVVSGGTGSGKTTFLNALSDHVPDRERIVTLEDAAEIRLQKPHVVRMEGRPANVEGSGAIPIRELLRNALRMRPDRIIVGECRGGEALDMLQAMNTGHDGSMTTAHANSPRDVLSRLETMVLMGDVDLPSRAIREQIASAVDVIVHLSRSGNGKRGVQSITEVAGMGDSQILLQEIFRRERPTTELPDPLLLPTGVPSSFGRAA
jgi:pilus assembly protein CpaF